MSWNDEHAMDNGERKIVTNAAIKLLTESQAAQNIVLSGSGSGILSLFDDSLLFIGSMAVAVKSGEFVYYVDGQYTTGQMKAINSFSRVHSDCPLVRVASSQFDFIVGSTLTKAGLPLTRRDDTR